MSLYFIRHFVLFYYKHPYCSGFCSSDCCLTDSSPVHSVKKLISKEERKLRRKQHRAATSIAKDEMNSLKIEDKTEKEADKGINQCK